MPIPSVEPSPPLAKASRFVVPLEAQEASYFAASDKMANRSFKDFCINVHYMFLLKMSMEIGVRLQMLVKVLSSKVHNYCIIKLKYYLNF